MEQAGFREYLKTEAFNFVNIQYNEWNIANPNQRWNDAQMAVVEGFVTRSINNIVNSIRGWPLTQEARERQRHRLFARLRSFFFNDNPEEIVADIREAGDGMIGGRKSKKSRKSRKSKKSRKSRKSKTIRKRK
jgi:hypothetical protein